MLGATGVFSEIDIQVERRAPPPTEVRDAAPRPHSAPATRSRPARSCGEPTRATPCREQLKFFNYILLGFAGVALFVGIFLILNTFSIIVAQRTRELALMRAIGASRRQVLRLRADRGPRHRADRLRSSASGAGIGVGAAARLACSASFVGGMQLASVGVPADRGHSPSPSASGVTVVAAFLPALRASRIPPMAALQEAATPDRPLTRLTVGGAVVDRGRRYAALALGLTGQAGGPRPVARSSAGSWSPSSASRC